MPSNQIERQLLNHIPAMVAYWNTDQKCVFSNSAYRDWFGREPGAMAGITMGELLGPLYVKNLPFIHGALNGRTQIFERQIPLPSGEVRDSIATYTPDIINGVVHGFSAHVADVTQLRRRESKLLQEIHDTIQILEGTRRQFQSKQLGSLRERLVRVSKSWEQ